LKTYSAEVVEVLENGDAVISFMDEMLQELGWKEGDTISITTEGNTIILKKVDEESDNDNKG
jgi:formylmethanofuran dehydrogenase subunit D